MARMTKAEKTAEKTRQEMLRAEAVRIVTSGICPTCGRKGFRRNLAMAGWYQCTQYGAEGFRADASQPSCSFQTFTE